MNMPLLGLTLNNFYTLETVDTPLIFLYTSLSFCAYTYSSQGICHRFVRIIH